MGQKPQSTSRRRPLRHLVVFALIGALVVGALPAGATPVCPEEPRTACGGRIFPEPENTVSFVQHDNGEYEAGIKALAKEFPRFVKVRKFSDILGPKAKSAGGRELWLVEITDFRAPERGKIPVAISLAVHGPERAGLEGGVRYMEDLARWAKNEPRHKLRNGTNKDSMAVSVRDTLKKVHIYLAAVNADGWARGDYENGGVYMRGNANGFDLNRQFPTIGWTRPTNQPLSQPEAIAWRRLMLRVRPVVTADLHGELTSAQNAFTDLMLPAGQWNPRKQKREERLARHMKTNVERWFEKEGVDAATVSGIAGMKPAEYATGYDVVGYDASGFMGDWLNQEIGAVDMDSEHFMSHLVPNSTWVHSLEEAHITAVRGEIEAVIVEALVTKKVQVRYALGKVGYFNDPAVVTNKDGYGGPPPAEGYKPEPYRATRMEYFRDLSRFTTKPLRALTRRSLLRGGLRGLDTLVLADKPFGTQFKGRKGQWGRALRKIKRFVKRGGNLVLTDRAIKLVRRFRLVPKGSIKKHLYNAGHIDIHNWKDPYVRGVYHTARQTYYEVPLGFSADADASPHFTIDKAAWEKAGGKSIAHIEEEDRIGLGRLKLGKGTIGIFGAILPQPTEKFDHYYGLAGYAVSVAGGQILKNMMAVGR